jgi:lysophospholipase L1-like esterase
VAGTSPSERRIGRYVALGDSYSAGVPGVPEAGRWPDHLAEILRADEPDLDYRNLAAVGATSADVAREQVGRCIELRPSLVTLVCGANDVLLSTRPDVSAYRARLGQMLKRLREALPAATVLTATTPDLSTHMPLGPLTRRRVSRGMREVNETTRSVARLLGVPCVEFADDPRARDRENFADDGYHPSAIGNHRTALAFAAVLRGHQIVEVTT